MKAAMLRWLLRQFTPDLVAAIEQGAALAVRLPRDARAGDLSGDVTKLKALIRRERG